MRQELVLLSGEYWCEEFGVIVCREECKICKISDCEHNPMKKPEETSCKIFLVFERWVYKKTCKRADYNDIPSGADLDFHSGCTYYGTIEVDTECFEALKEGIDAGLAPIFTVGIKPEDSP